MSETDEKCPKMTSSDVLFRPQAKDIQFTVTEERNRKQTSQSLYYSSVTKAVLSPSNMPPCLPSRSYLRLQDVQWHIKARGRKTLRQPVVKTAAVGRQSSAARIPGISVPEQTQLL